jgi:hypothetical protein
MKKALNRFELRRTLPMSARAAARSSLERLGEATSRSRPLPDFLIIGAQKAATTALYRYLASHPSVRPAIRKEIHYFDLQHGRGERWYRGHFPRRPDSPGSTPPFITGEATPYYLFHPLVPGRVADLAPDVKLIAMLRDPVRRAISHYYHAASNGFESRSLDRAIAEEPDMIAAEEARVASGLPPTPAHQHRSYLSRGLYAEQLLRWMGRFTPDQMLIVSAERLSRDGGITYRRVLAFLGLPFDERTSFEFVHRGVYPEPDPVLMDRLREHFIHPNQQLLTLIGQERWDEFPWIGPTRSEELVVHDRRSGGDAGIRTLDGAQHPVTA